MEKPCGDAMEVSRFLNRGRTERFCSEKLGRGKALIRWRGKKVVLGVLKHISLRSHWYMLDSRRASMRRPSGGPGEDYFLPLFIHIFTLSALHS